MWWRILLIGAVFLALAAFACQPDGARVPPAADAESREVVAGTAPPPAPAAAGTPRPTASSIDLIAPVFPAVGLDTHSSECDPFADDSEICL